MIIQINATVCAAVDHGDDGRHKIAGSNHGRDVIQRQEEKGDQGKRKAQVMQRNVGSLGDGGTATIAARQRIDAQGAVRVSPYVSRWSSPPWYVPI